MTPRVLVMAIATTAFGFALIISSVAGSTSAAIGGVSRPLAAVSRHTIHVQPYHALAADDDGVYTFSGLE